MSEDTWVRARFFDEENQVAGERQYTRIVCLCNCADLSLLVAWCPYLPLCFTRLCGEFLVPFLKAKTAPPLGWPSPFRLVYSVACS